QVRWAAPHQAFLSLRTDRPTTLAGEVAGCWNVDEEGSSATLLVDVAEQGHSLQGTAAHVRVHLPRGGIAVPCGGRWSVRGYLRPPRVYRNGTVTEVGSWSVWVKSRSLALLERGPDLLSRVSGAARARLFDDGAPREGPLRPGLGLARALLLGDG